MPPNYRNISPVQLMSICKGELLVIHHDSLDLRCQSSVVTIGNFSMR